jgi:uncharacterized membrane protein YphA (DoxX/SURF4 family)
LKNLGLYLFGIANVAMGVLNLVWDNFDPAHQPIQAFGDTIPGRGIYAYIAGVLLVGGGIVILLRGRSARFGALALAFINIVVGIFWFPRFYTVPHYLGLSFSSMAGVLGGVCRQLIIVVAALLVYLEVSGREPRLQDSVTAAARWIFGLSSIVFGSVHLSSALANISYVPAWMPFGRTFWVVLTGVAFVLAGIAILTGILDILAARLLALMLLVFSLVTLIPNLIASPHQLDRWGGNVHEFVLIGAVLIFAEWLRRSAGLTRTLREA